MLSAEDVSRIADELAEADRTHGVIPRITARYPGATVEDSYAIQGVWRDQNIAAGRRLPPATIAASGAGALAVVALVGWAGSSLTNSTASSLSVVVAAAVVALSVVVLTGIAG